MSTWWSSITKQLSIQGGITLLEMKLITRVVISAGRGDFFSRGSSHICPNLQMTFSHASWWSFIYCFHADLMSLMQGTFNPMIIKTPRRRGYYKCGGISRVLKYGDSFIEQQGITTMTGCWRFRRFSVMFSFFFFDCTMMVSAGSRTQPHYTTLHYPGIIHIMRVNENE